MDVDLKKYFPMIREREEILEEIENNILLKGKYESWTLGKQRNFLDMCTSVRGLKLLYDGFLKKS